MYIKGSLSEKDCAAIKLFAEKFQCIQADCENICQNFIDAVKQSLNIDLVLVPLKCVFRIK